MGLKGLEVRVWEIEYAWPIEGHPEWAHSGYMGVWEIPLVIHPGPCRDHRYFKPEVVSTLEKRLLRDMQGGNGEIKIQTESYEQEGDSRSSKGKGKRGAPNVEIMGRKK